MRTLGRWRVNLPIHFGGHDITVTGWYTRDRSDAGPEEDFEIDEYTGPDEIDQSLLESLCIEECQLLAQGGNQ